MAAGEKKGYARFLMPLVASRKLSRVRPEFRSPVPRPAFSQRDAYAGAFLVLIVAIFYFPATRAGFVWDDLIITSLHSISSWEGILQIWLDPVSAYFQTDVAENHYWPVVYTTFWVEHKLWGFSPVGYHVVNVLLHIANTALLWRLLVRLSVPGAWFAAAVFAVHPVHTEPAVWVMGRKDLLSALFYLAAVSMWFRHLESPRRRLYAAVFLFFAAAMLSKSIAITLPVALLIILWWKRGRVAREDVIRVLPFFLLAFVVGGADFWFYKSQGLGSFDYSMVERALLAARSLWFYVGKLIWPVGLAGVYPLWEVRVSDPLGWLCVAATAATLAGLWMLRRRIGRGPLAYFLFFGVTLSPTLGFIDYHHMTYSFVADRYQYLAGIGIIVLFAAGATRLARELPPAAGRVVKGIALMTLVVLGLLTWNQAGVYKDELTFFNHVILHNPRARGAHYNIGLEFYRQGRVAEAEKYFRRAVEINPRDTKSLYNLGEILRAQGKYEESLGTYLSVIGIKPESSGAFFGMGNALFELGRYSEALSSMRQSLVLGIDPSMVPASHHVMGQALLKMGQNEEAEIQFDLSMESSLAINPGGTEAFMNRAEIFRGQKRCEEALGLYLLALDTDPGHASAYAGMGDCLYRMDRYREAISSLERAVSLLPDSPMEPTLYYLMGQAAAEADWLEEAGAHYESALRVAPHFTEALKRLADLRFGQERYVQALSLYRVLVGTGSENAKIYSNIGVALLSTGKASEAIQSFERALSLDPSLESARSGIKRAREVSPKETDEERSRDDVLTEKTPH